MVCVVCDPPDSSSFADERDKIAPDLWEERANRSFLSFLSTLLDFVETKSHLRSPRMEKTRIRVKYRYLSPHILYADCQSMSWLSWL